MSDQGSFDEIHGLLRAGEHETALARLYDSKSDAIRAPYTEDRNHAWYIVGDVFYRLGQYDSARLAFLHALEEWPEDAEAYWALGDVFDEMGQPAEAEKMLRAALKLRPESAEIRYNLGNALFDQGKCAAATEVYKDVQTDNKALSRKVSRNLRLARNKLGAYSKKGTRSTFRRSTGSNKRATT